MVGKGLRRTPLYGEKVCGAVKLASHLFGLHRVERLTTLLFVSNMPEVYANK